MDTLLGGAEAIALYALHRSEIAVVLTDMMMPVMDGASLIAAMRRIMPEVKVVIASGQHIAPARLENMNVRHVLAKPYSAEVLLCALHDALKEESLEPLPTTFVPSTPVHRAMEMAMA